MSKHPLRHLMDSILADIGTGYRAKQAPPIEDDFDFTANKNGVTKRWLCDCGDDALPGVTGPGHTTTCHRCKEMNTADAKKYGFRDGMMKWCKCCTVRLVVPGLELCSRRSCQERAGYWV